MDLDKLKAELAKHDIKVGFFNKRLYAQLAAQLPEDAEILAACVGYSRKSANATPLIVTPDKVYMIGYSHLMGGIDYVVIRRDGITGVEVSGGMAAGLRISTKGEAYSVEKIPQPVAMKIAGILSP